MTRVSKHRRWLRNRLNMLLLLALCSGMWAAKPAQPVHAGADGVVISQIYAGGGNSGATYSNDFIELHNTSASSVDLSGWSIQYASATGDTWSNRTNLTGSIPGGAYYLVRGASGSSGSALPTPDVTGSINMANGGGKLALVKSQTALSGGCPLPDSLIADFVGWGSAGCKETAVAAPISDNTTAAARVSDGCQDTDDNANDFSLVAVAPRNSATPLNVCAPVSTNPRGTGLASPAVVDPGETTLLTVTTIPGTNPASATLSVSADLSAIGGGSQAFFDDGSHGDVTAGNGVFSFQYTLPANTSLATYSLPVTIQDNLARTGSASIALTVGDVCSATPFTPVYTLQGSGADSALIGQTVTTRGIVTADWQSGFFAGYYLQDAAGDGNPATSDGLFIQNNTYPVSVGDEVLVTGKVSEDAISSSANSYKLDVTHLTSLTGVTLCQQGQAPAPTVVTLPEQVNGDLERYEGMLVKFEQTLTVSQNYFLGRYGQVTLSADGRLYNPTNGNVPGLPTQIMEANSRRLLVLDDASFIQNPNPTPYLETSGNTLVHTLRPGDTVTGLTGIIDYGLINTYNNGASDYRLQPTVKPSFTYVNERPAAPAAVGGNLKVATFNVLNYFNGDGTGGGFPTARGANTLAEFNRQRVKIINALKLLDADIVGIMEIERDGTGPTSAIQDLVNGLNAAYGAETYRFIVEPAPGSDAIKVSMIYKPAVVGLSGAAQNYQTSAGGYSSVFSRPPLVQTFSLNTNPNLRLTVVVNHFKSRGCGDATGADLDQGDLLGCYNARRTAQGTALAAFVNTLKATEPNVIVLGDLNAYATEPPLAALEAQPAGLIDQSMVHVPQAERYSYIFDGMAGQFDYILASPTLSAQATGASIWHINTDEASVLDYNTEFKTQDLYSNDVYRSSDHDPAILGIQLAAPTVQILSHPAAIANTNQASFTYFGSYAGLTFECSLDGGAYAACPSPVTYQGLSSGAHTFAVRAVHSAYNKSQPASFEWTVDLTTPAAPTLTSPTNLQVLSYEKSYPTFQGTAAAGVTVTVWRVDGVGQGAYTQLCSASADSNGQWSCTSQVKLEAGRHSVAANATGSGGGASPYSTPVAFMIEFARFLGVIIQ